MRAYRRRAPSSGYSELKVGDDDDFFGRSFSVLWLEGEGKKEIVKNIPGRVLADSECREQRLQRDNDDRWSGGRELLIRAR